MKGLVQGFIKWLLIVLATLTIVVWSTQIMRCQAAKPKDPEAHPLHVSLEDFEDTIGYRTVIILSKDDRLIYYKKETKRSIFLGSFGYDKTTRFDDTKFEGRYCVVYCKTHQFAYIVSPCK